MHGRTLRKKSYRIIPLVLSLLLVMSTPISASASTRAVPNENADRWGTGASCPTYPHISGSYETIDRLESVAENEKEFVMKVQAGGHTLELFLTFPDTGGFRLNTNSKGYFEPAGNGKIVYQKSADGKVTMKAEDGTTVIFEQKDSGFRLSVCNGEGKRLFGITPGQIGFSFENGKVIKVRLELPLAEQESIYGSGERFNDYDQVGKRLLMWNVDVGYNRPYSSLADSEMWRGYKNIPILHSNRGYTLFFNSYYSGSTDIGWTDSNKYTMEFQGPDFDFYVWTGTPKENLADYAGLTGTTLVLPKWAFSYIPGQHSSVWNSYGGSMLGTILKMQQGFKELGTPNIAAAYCEGADITDAKIYNALKKTGTRLLTWNPPDHNVNTMKGFLPGVDTLDLPITKSMTNPVSDVGCFVDFTDPLAKTMITNRVGNYARVGWAGGLLDFGELIPLRALFRGNGTTGEEMHNMFPYWVGKVYHEVMDETTVDGGVTFSRAGCAGAQSYTAFFTGDQYTGTYGMSRQLIAGLSGSASGLTMWGADLGGLDGTPSDEMYARSMEFSAFQPIMRAHGTSSRFPWDYGTVGKKTYQKYYWLRENLVDKIYSSNISSSKTGLPLTVALNMEYPNVQEYDGLYTTYIFCDDFLVTPVIEEQSYLYDVTFPTGSWYGLENGEKVEGGETKKVEAPVDFIPVYIKAGAAIPVKIGESLKLADSMQDVDTTEALIVTIPDEERESQFWKDEDTCVTYTSTRVDDSTFAINAGEGNDAIAVILKGSASYGVTVDGTKLERLYSQPISKGQAGYYCRDNGQTIINIGNNDWKQIEISLGEFKLENLMKDATVNNEKLQTTIDGDYETIYAISTKESEQDLIYELKKATAVETIKVKWTSVYAEKYKVSISSDGNNWKEVLNEEEGYGGIKVIDAEAENVKYIKIHDVERKTGIIPVLYEVEAYGAADEEHVSGNLVQQLENFLWDVLHGDLEKSYVIIIFSIAVLTIAVSAIVIVVLRKKKQNKMHATKEE